MLRRQLGMSQPLSKGLPMTTNSSAQVPTTHASRYLQQLCKHWSHNLAVAFDEAKGTVKIGRAHV